MRAQTVALLLASLPAAAEVTITPQGDRVSVRVVAAPLSDVLEQLSRTTGMKVIYEGAVPRLPVTVTVEGRTPVEAVLAVMAGQGLNFGLRSDAAGQRVDRLLIAGQAHATGGPTPSTPVPAPGAGDTNLTLTFDQDESVDEKGEEDPEPAIKLPSPSTRAPGPPVGPTFQAPPAPAYPNSPFAPQPQPQATPPPPPPPPEPDEEKELD